MTWEDAKELTIILDFNFCDKKDLEDVVWGLNTYFSEFFWKTTDISDSGYIGLKVKRRSARQRGETQ